jgi:hypothetical protein
MGRLEGRVIIVTGGSRGIGAAMSRLFAEEGARVVIADIRDDLGEGLVASMQNAGGDVEYRHLDVSRPGSGSFPASGLRSDRQHLIVRGPCSHPGRRTLLCRDQGSDPAHDQERGDRLCQAEHPCQLGPSWSHPDGYVGRDRCRYL